MAPKKNGMTASTPAVANTVSTFRGIVDSSGPSSIEESSFVIRNEISDDLLLKTKIFPNKKITTLDLMYKAIEVVGVPRKGASYIAIQKWIINNKENVVIGRLKANLKKAVLKALENGILKRAAVSKNATGLQGYFLLNKDSLKKQIQSKTSTKKTVTKKANKDMNEMTSLSDTEVTKKPRKINTGRLNKSATEDGNRKKAVSKVNANILGMKKATSKVVKEKAAPLLASKAKNKPAPKAKNAPAPKETNAPAPKAKKTKGSKAKNALSPKTKSAPVPKEKHASAPKEKNAPIPKEKVAPAPKGKKALVRKIKHTVVPESEIASTSESESEVASTSKPKVAKASKLKTKFVPISKSKTKAVVAKEILEEAEPIPKPNLTRVKTKEIVDSTVPEESEGEDMKQVPEKSKEKVALKPPKNNLTRTKKLYSSRMNPEANMSRKDLSDTELTVKPINRKSLKSYSSDTEIDVIKKDKANKAPKVAKTKKLAADVSEVVSAKPKVTKKQKAKNV